MRRILFSVMAIFISMTMTNAQNIDFKDPLVKEICVENWDTNHDGELSYEEAAKVTDLNQAFRSQRNISSFDELQYFTGLTCIENEAFYVCTQLTSIVLPNNVNRIEPFAFSSCESLSSVTIPNSVVRIGRYAFQECIRLKAIELPNSITIIDEGAFFNCEGLESIEIPSSVSIIGYCVFGGCTSLVSISVSENNVFYDSRDNCNAIIEKSSNNLIAGCNNTTIPNSVKSIGNDAFHKSGITSLNIPNSVTSIGHSAFEMCALTSIDIPNSVVSIGSCAFMDCYQLISAVIPSSVEVIGDDIFDSCSQLMSLEVKNPKPIKIRSIISYFMNTTLYVPKGSLSAYRSAVGWKDFKNIVEKDFPIDFVDPTVKEICLDNWDANKDGEFSMEEATKVTELRGVFRENKEITSFDELQFFTGLNSLATYDDSGVKNGEFSGCINLASVIISNSVANIGDYSFFECGNLTNIRIPNSVSSIGDFAFNGCDNLASIIIDATTPPTIQENTFGNYNATLYVPTGCVYEYQSANLWKNFLETVEFRTKDAIDFKDSEVKQICVSKWDINGDGELSKAEASLVFNMGGCFKNRYNITSFDEFQYFTGMRWLGYIDDDEEQPNSFQGCDQLAHIIIPNSIEYISQGTFADCESLTSIHIPRSVVRIDDGILARCSSLRSITVSEDNLCYDSRDNCNAIIDKFTNKLISGCMNTVIPNSVTKIAPDAFYGCYDLAKISIPSSVTEIGSEAFGECDNLSSVIVNISTPLVIANNTFSNYDATLYVPKGSKEAYLQAEVWKEFARIIEFSDDAYSDTDYIAFADPKVKEICVAHWDFNNDGELSKAEAAMVTDLEEAFCNNVDITSFDELQYFTGLDVIEECAFFECRNLGSIVMPESVTTIEGNAFQGCESLTNIHIPKAVTEICSGILGFCNQLQSITVAEDNPHFFSPDNCNAIIERESGELVCGCATTVIPQYVTTIGAEAFIGCKGITSVNLPDALTCIEGRAFAYSGLTDISIPNSVTAIDPEAFVGCSALTSVVLPNTLSTISISTFEDCTSLTDIEIPNTVTTIEGGAFEDCTSLTAINIPRSVTSIGNYVFYGCANLTSITVDIPSPVAIEQYTFSNYNATLYVPKGSEEAYKRANYWKKFKFIEKIYLPVPYALLANDGKTLSFYDDDAADEREGTVYMVGNAGTPSWHGQCDNVTTVTFDTSFAEEYPSSLQQWFDGMTKLMSVEGMEYLNTEETTTMNAMFRDCSSLRRVDLEHLDLSLCTDISEMFSGCSSLASLDLSGISLAEGSNSSGMLMNCNSLKTLKLSMSMAALDDDACQGVGTARKPCLLFVPDGFEFGTEATGAFLWKSGYFRVAPEPVIYANDIEFFSGQTKGVAVCLKNGNEIYNGYQFDLFLPEGFRFVTNVAGQVAYSLSDRYSGTPTVTTNMLDDNTCRVMVFMDSGDYIADVNGTIISFSVHADSELPMGSWEGTLTNVFVNLQSNATFKCADSAFNLVVGPEMEYIVGDANHDGFINISDVTAIISYILNKKPSPFYISEADVNADGWVNVSDVSCIISIILHGYGAEAPANINVTASDKVLIGQNPNGYDLSVCNTIPYTACEMTLCLPEGCSLRHAVIDEERDGNYKVMTHDLGGGVYRMVVYSSDNASLETGSAPFVHLTIDGSVTDDVRLSDILFVDEQNSCVAFPDATGTTGITTTTIDSDNSPAYNLQGVLVEKNYRGVHVRKGKKMVVR